MLILSMDFWGCQEEVEKDNILPSVNITYPQNNSSISEMVTITCISTDDEGIYFFNNTLKIGLNIYP